MAGSVLVALAIYLPFINLYLNPQKVLATLPGSDFYLTIPKIEAQAPIIANVDPWNESTYLPVLQQGIGSATGSVSPDQKGLIYLFAHSSDVPWRITRYNTAFLRLGDLKAGDQIVITKNNQRYNFVMDKSVEVWPSDVTYLKALELNSRGIEESQQTTLILQTCTPIGTSLKRLLVFAHRV